ncbi:MAG: type II toxin-antitoxin system HipA family toxin [Candidatus Omnitrophica bacterium]|nr:type II toxin-antitoxin system HipA family toxin [Candidatus Omnitrophota bacterium]
MTIAEVRLWGKKIGAVSWDDTKNIAYFEYDPGFVKSGIEVSPLMMPLSAQIFSFPALRPETFHGLPGLLADSLPDRFGNALIDVWLAKKGRLPESFNSVERLCYIGTRGMGALEFMPAQRLMRESSKNIDIESLVELASEILSKRGSLRSSFSIAAPDQALRAILKVGTSAGGARAKAVIAWNSQTQEVRSGQIDAGSGFSHWILKFDGVSGNSDKDFDTTSGYGRIEFAYAGMARAAGITVSECRLLHENSRSHFMTKRFDRGDSGGKIHMQSLGALAHYDFNQAGAYSYEQAVQVMRKLNLPMAEIEELFRRAVFNIMARNQDDHVKNIAFLMNKSGQWRLSPAFDMIYSYNPAGRWTNRHQMSFNGKREGFSRDDFSAFAKTVSLQQGRAVKIVEDVAAAVARWPQFAQEAGIPDAVMEKIRAAHLPH